MRKIIVAITKDDLDQLLGIDSWPNVVRQIIIDGDYLKIIIVSPALPPDFETSPGEFITHVSLATMHMITGKQIEL